MDIREIATIEVENGRRGYFDGEIEMTVCDESESERRHEFAPTRRRFHLFHLLYFNYCTREDIFEQMREYYLGDDGDTLLDERALKNVRRTFLRDLQHLESVGYEIEKFQRGGTTCYHIVEGSGPAGPFLFSQKELDVLVLLHTLFANPAAYSNGEPGLPLPSQPQNPFAQDILALIERLVATLPPKQKREFERWVRKPYVYMNMDTVTDYLPHRASIDLLIRAICLQRKINFEYRPLHKSITTPHKQVDPYYVIHQDGHLYLVGYLHNTYSTMYSRFFEYRIDRIMPESIEVLPESIDHEQRRKPIEFCFWIDASIAKSGLSKRWLCQKIERGETFVDATGREQRRVLVRAQAYDEWRIIQQLLKYGDKAELVEPLPLREKMKQTLENMGRLYE